jgi:hypothetical protein
MTAGLLGEITENFANVPPPMRIVENPSDPEAATVASALRGKDWKTIPDDVLMANRSASAFLTPAAYRYFLPAFMKLAINRYAEADTLVHDLIASMTLPRPEDIAVVERALAALGTATETGFEPLLQAYRSGAAEQRFRARVATLNNVQRATVRHFLEHMRDAHGQDFAVLGPKEALERHWAEPAAP